MLWRIPSSRSRRPPPAGFIYGAIDAKRGADIAPPEIHQRALASLIEDGFEIVVDQESAIITGDLTLAVLRPVTGGMVVRITLPNDKTIEFQTSDAKLIGD
jgi:hypothetical protein